MNIPHVQALSTVETPLATPGTYVWVRGPPSGGRTVERIVQALEAVSELFRPETLGSWVGRLSLGG